MMNEPPYGPDCDYGSTDSLVIIREIFDGAHELFENELEHALDNRCQTIVIEPCRLGEETARWIEVGDYLAGASIIAGVGSIACGAIWPDRISAHYSLLTASLIANGAHTLSWQSDACSAYRIERDPAAWTALMADASKRFPDNVSLVTSTEYMLQNTATSATGGGSNLIPSAGAAAAAASSGQKSQSIQQQLSAKYMPVILCRRSDAQIRRRNWLKAAVSLLAFAFSMFRLFKTAITTRTAATRFTSAALPIRFTLF